ncbi:restriction endonuclease, partial [Streptomyces sp. NPDC047939]|uniref:restriction endonuclease n=1 Tax=Streptomyces sp. NPDC047939 TaxID=3155381 RepID=UPI00342E0D1B
AALCERDGCSEVQVVGGAGDLGADVIATAPDGRHMVVQCKCYSPATKVGSQDLQRFGGTCYAVHEAEIAVCVTTSAYTGPALDYADQCGIQCLDGEALSAWSEGSAPPPWQTDPGP